MTDLNKFHKETSERYYKMLLTVYKHRMSLAFDKAYALNEFLKHSKAVLVFRFEEGYFANILQQLLHDYRIGKDLGLSIKLIRKNNNNVNDNFEISFIDLNIEQEEQETTEEKISIQDNYVDLTDYSDEHIIRIFSKYMAYNEFYKYLENENLELSSHSFEVQKPIITDESNDKKKDFTTARQVIAVHYLLKYVNVRNVDKTEIARFIQFLTGKNLDNIYKKLQNPFKVNDKALNEDLRFVRNYFERLNLTEIVKMINNEIS